MKGSVRQRGSTWGYRFRNPVPDPVTGKREWVTEDGFRTEREAWKACRGAIGEAEKGRHVSRSKQTVQEFLAEEWLPSIKLVVDATTYENWKNYTNAYVVPHLGSVRLQQISAVKLNLFYALLMEKGRLTTADSARSPDRDRAEGVASRSAIRAGRAFGNGLNREGYVFTWEDGRPVHPQAVRERFIVKSAEVGLPQIRLHDMRHSYATNSLKAGVNPKIVSERIGHASMAFTLDVYSHVLPGVDRDAAEQMAALILGELDDEDDEAV